MHTLEDMKGCEDGLSMPLGVHLRTETRRCSGKDELFLQRAGFFFKPSKLYSSSFLSSRSSKMALKIFSGIHCYFQEAGKSAKNMYHLPI